MANQSSTPFDQGLFLVHLNRGREHFDNRSFADAAEELEEARKLRPNDDSVLNLLGLAYFKQEKYREADSVYQKLLELNPDSYTLQFNLGLVCFKLGDLDRAESTFLHALELKPDNQKTHFYLGNIYERKKQYYNAIFQYRKAGANIMVKRVQEKIDLERDVATESSPPPRVRSRVEPDFLGTADSDFDDTSPSLALVGERSSEDERARKNHDLRKVNVDHLDTQGFLAALQEGLIKHAEETDTKETDRPDDIREPLQETASVDDFPQASGSAWESESEYEPDREQEQEQERERVPADTFPGLPDEDDLSGEPDFPSPRAPRTMPERITRPEAEPSRTPAYQDAWTAPDQSPRVPSAHARRRPGAKGPDTQDVVLSPVEQQVLSDGLASPPGINTIPPGGLDEPRHRTRLRLSEPIIQDQTLAEMARAKTPEHASSELFARGDLAQRGRRSEDRRRAADIPPAEPIFSSSRREREPAEPQHFRWRAAEQSRESNLYSRMRRRDDIFRYLENNLMEVNFSGKVFIKQGTIYSYSGNLTFWVKPQREEQVPPLVIVSGTGKLLLTDLQRDITVMQIEDDEIFVEPSHLLACQETLTPRYAVVEKEGSQNGGLHVLLIQGTGMLALSVATSPLVLTVQDEYPVNVSSNSLISWSGSLTPTIVDDEALADLMLPGAKRGLNLRLEGEGRVMMEKS